MKLLHGDCLEEMKHIESGSIDMVLTDPPYGTTACKWDAVIPFDLMWKNLKRIIKPNGAIVMTASQPFTSALVMSNPKMFKYCWTWVKTQAVGHLNAYKQPMRKTEQVLVFYSKQCVYNYQIEDKLKHNIRPHSNSGKTANYGKYNGNQKDNRKIPLDKKMPENVLQFANEQGTVHPTQKPVVLMEYLIKTYTNEGEIVLDFTMGSGTTGVACKRLNRNFIGIEKDDGYFEIAKNRIEEAEARVEHAIEESKEEVQESEFEDINDLF